MKSESTTGAVERRLDPRTEEILREVASDSESCLLRASRRELDEALTRADWSGLRTLVGFSSAERELLCTAREEIAYWLNVMCFKRLTEDESTRRYCTRLVEGDREYVAPTLQAVRTGLDESTASARELGAVGAPLEQVLEQLVLGVRADAPPRAVEVHQLASASLRLHPTFQARHYAVQANQGFGDGVSSIRLARQLAALARGRLERAYSLAQIAQAHSSLGDFVGSCIQYGAAADAAPTMGELRLRALGAAVLAEDRARADELLRGVDAMDREAAAVRVVCAAFRTRRDELSVPALDLVHGLLERAGATGREVLNALAAS